MKLLGAIAILLTFAVCCVAVMAAATSGPQATPDFLEGLRKRAEGASGAERAKLKLELAQREVEDANTKFTSGDADHAKAEVALASSDAEGAVDSAIRSGKRLKQTELAIHELSRRLDDIGRAVSFDDREPIHVAVERLQKLDRSLLEAMFHKKK